MWKPFAAVEDPRERHLLLAVFVPAYAVIPLLLWGNSTRNPGPTIGVAVAGLMSVGSMGALLAYTFRRSRRAWEPHPLVVSPASARQQAGAMVIRRSLASRLTLILGVGGIFAIPVGDSIVNGFDPWLMGLELAGLAVIGPFVVKFVRDEAIVTDEMLLVRWFRGWRHMCWAEVVDVTPTHDGLVLKAIDGRVLVVPVGVRTRLRFQRPAIDPRLLEVVRSRVPTSVSFSGPRRW